MVIKKFCDKCDKEMAHENRALPIGFAIKIDINDHILKKEYCRECTAKLLPGCVITDTTKLDRTLANKTLGERFEDLLREIVQDEVF